MSIGEKIKEKREELGWTQQELADKMGYKSKSTINKIELGINDINQEKIKKFSEVLGCSISYLMDWIPAKEEQPSYVLTNNDEILLIDAFRSADEVTKDMISRILLYNLIKEKEGESNGNGKKD